MLKFGPDKHLVSIAKEDNLRAIVFEIVQTVETRGYPILIPKLEICSSTRDQGFKY